MLGGGVVVLAESLRLLAAHTESLAGADSKGSAWPEFARYDCRACHHDLERKSGEPSWRQARGFASAAGRPVLPAWSSVLVPLAIEVVGKDRAEVESMSVQFRDGYRALNQAFGARPFGDPRGVTQAARALADWTDKLAGRLRSIPIGRGEALRALHRLCDLGRSQAYDFDTARQLAWAFEALYGDLGESLPRDDAVRSVLAEWKSQLQTELPQWRGPKLDDSLAQFLGISADYRSERFQEQMRVLATRLGAR
jgi:hypothetical protein